MAESVVWRRSLDTHNLKNIAIRDNVFLLTFAIYPVYYA